MGDFTSTRKEHVIRTLLSCGGEITHRKTVFTVSAKYLVTNCVGWATCALKCTRPTQPDEAGGALLVPETVGFAVTCPHSCVVLHNEAGQKGGAIARICAAHSALTSRGAVTKLIGKLALDAGAHAASGWWGRVV